MNTTTERVLSLLSPAQRAGLSFYRVESWRDFDADRDAGESIPYGWLESCREADASFATVSALVGSDYSGGALVRANVKAWDELAADSPLSFGTHGGLGTNGRLLRIDAPLTDDNRDKAAELVEALAGLCDYPSLDDDALSEQEAEEEAEAWANYAARDFARALEKRFGVDIEADDDALRDYFSALAERANLNGGPGVIHESDGPFFMVDDAAEAANLAEIAFLGMIYNGDTETGIALAVDNPEAARELLRARAIADGMKALADALPEGQDREGFALNMQHETDAEGRPVLVVRRFVWSKGPSMGGSYRTARVGVGSGFLADPATGEYVAAFGDVERIRAALVAALFSEEPTA